ncbi:MAG: ABC transporter ATP-binding protein [Myxococcota bacterium]
MSSAIAVVGLTKRFNRRRNLRPPFRRPPPVEALRGVDLRLEPGELVTLIGPNGAGKTTLLKILATLIRPTSGQASVQGLEVTQDPAGVRQRIGYVLADERSFFWRLKTRENLRFFAALEGIVGRAAEDRIRALAALVGLTEELDRDFQDLSTGQRQRLAIARGLLADPPVLLFDEATRSLDPGRAARLRRIIREILVEREKKAVLFATHDLVEAERLADRVALMAEGRVVEEGSFAALKPRIEALFLDESRAEDAAFQRLFPADSAPA